MELFLEWNLFENTTAIENENVSDCNDEIDHDWDPYFDAQMETWNETSEKCLEQIELAKIFKQNQMNVPGQFDDAEEDRREKCSKKDYEARLCNAHPWSTKNENRK